MENITNSTEANNLGVGEQNATLTPHLSESQVIYFVILTLHNR